MALEHRTDHARLILASASPRRRDLLARLGLPFVAVSPEIDEALDPSLPLPAAVADLAERKARLVADERAAGLVVGADTIVVIGTDALGKPRDEDDAVRMLCLLRGQIHEAITGVAVVDVASGRVERSAVVSSVRMRDYPDAAIAAYVATGEPLDKAGSYAVQGQGRALIAAVKGCYANVVGLPLCETASLLARFGRPVPARPPICRHPTGEPCPRLDSSRR
jgi:septum formation protein